MNLYAEHILDHYKNPRNVGAIEGGETASERNPLCGDEITVTLDAGDKIKEIKYKAQGCAITVASASILSELLVGKTRASVSDLTEADILSILNIDLTPARIKCAMLPVWTIKKALGNKGEK